MLRFPAIPQKIGLLLTAFGPLAACVILGIIVMPHSPAMDCAWFGKAQAFVDTNANGVMDKDEPPLVGVSFLVDDPYNHLTNVMGQARNSDQAGTAQLSVKLPGCPNAEFEIYTHAPTGYILTTPERLQAGSGSYQTFSFGFAPQK